MRRARGLHQVPLSFHTLLRLLRLLLLVLRLQLRHLRPQPRVLLLLRAELSLRCEQLRLLHAELFLHVEQLLLAQEGELLRGLHRLGRLFHRAVGGVLVGVHAAEKRVAFLFGVGEILIERGDCGDTAVETGVQGLLLFHQRVHAVVAQRLLLLVLAVTPPTDTHHRLEGRGQRAVVLQVHQLLCRDLHQRVATPHPLLLRSLRQCLELLH